jgi:Xaa-Pro aminopeptidase/Xaa-Pro dipeptidase
MFAPSIYQSRRRALSSAMPGGLLLFAGNDDASIDFRANAYPFVQDGCFRYFFGLDFPGLIGLVDVDAGESWLFGEDATIDATIWLGAQLSLSEQAAAIGIDKTGSLADLADHLRRAAAQGRAIHHPPPYRAETTLKLAALLDTAPDAVARHRAPELIAAIVALREIKEPAEVAEIEAALAVTREMHHMAMGALRPGVREHRIAGRVEGIARSADLRLAYQTVFTARGEILHNLRYDRELRAGDLVVHDAGAASPLGYASDITRTLPVSGRFDPLQRRLYEAVLRAQQSAIADARPGIRFIDLHLSAAYILVEELAALGLFRGDPARVVESGAYALCFQCGLGHQIGLDVHDMEALGEDNVGYDDEVGRSSLFGLANLRLGKRLRAGMTVTVEPGLYFIPQLIDLWRGEARHADMIDYDRFDAFRDFGGIRIEDDVLITGDGARILGEPIARSVDEVEARIGTMTG